jgi:hypothetical protein
LLLIFLLRPLDLCRWPPLCRPLVAVDTEQGRLDTALPAPQDDLRLEQSFVPRRDGLSEIELLLVRYGGQPSEDQPTDGDDGRFSLELIDDRGGRVAAEILPTNALSHNQLYSLRFPPQPDSAGRRYVLRLSGNDTNHISVWGYAADVYDAGEARLLYDARRDDPPLTEAQELRFVTRYALTAGDAARAAVAPLRHWSLLLAALLLLPLPGALLLLLVRPRGWDAGVVAGTALALGVAAWPIVWQWFSLAGGRFSGPILWAAVIVGWVAAIVWKLRITNYELRSKLRMTNDELRMKSAGDTRHSLHSYFVFRISYLLLLLALILLTVATRFIAIRDQAFPPWVDSSRHALITAVMVETGRAPDAYEPLLPVDHFPYHFGFHTLSAGLALMTGRPLPELLLLLMQLLGGLLPLAVYAAGWMATRRRAVGLLAAFLVALPFFFPGYYATWGRMTQLAAMVVMPVLLALTWRLGRGWPRVWPLVGVLAAGLFYIHFRVFLFYLPFAALVAVAHLVRYRRARGLLLAGLLGLLLVLPRLIELLAVTNPLATIGQTLPGYNDFPTGYLTTGWERVYLWLAAAAAIVVLLGTALRRRWVTFPLLLLLWVAALFALLAGDRLGLPETLVVNLNSMYITLFLPLALLLAIVAGRVVRPAVVRRRPAIGYLLAVVSGVALALLFLFGWRQQANILNQQTILALPEDAAALAWIDANLPAEARVAVSAWQWLGVTWAASDGGAWLTPLTGREATTPPIDHIYNRDLFAQVRAFNEAASAVEDWGDPATAEWLAEQGVSHVFVGRRGGFLDPAELLRNPALDLLYRHDGTFIFAVR